MKRTKHALMRFGTLLLVFNLLLGSSRALQGDNGVFHWTDATVIAHCLGQVDGRYYTNSKEAFLDSCRRGIRVLETDFTMTSDGVLAVRHDFGANSASALQQPELVGAVTAEQHLTTPILGQYTALTAGGLLTLMKEHPEVWVVTDTKETAPALVCRQFELLAAAADAVDAREVLDRLVIQVYNTEMKAVIEEIYPFQNWILTVYQLPMESDYAALADYCAANGIAAMTVPVTRLSRTLSAAVKARGLKLYTHTVNETASIETCLMLGADGVYTDSRTEQEVRMLRAGKKISLTVELFQTAAVKLLGRAG